VRIPITGSLPTLPNEIMISYSEHAKVVEAGEKAARAAHTNHLALNALAAALVMDKHRWTPEEMKLYQNATQCYNDHRGELCAAVTVPREQTIKHSKGDDAKEIIRRLQERNPEFLEQIKTGVISLSELAEIIITQYKAFNA
jgi:hypothetical protein